MVCVGASLLGKLGKCLQLIQAMAPKYFCNYFLKYRVWVGVHAITMIAVR